MICTGADIGRSQMWNKCFLGTPAAALLHCALTSVPLVGWRQKRRDARYGNGRHPQCRTPPQDSDPAMLFEIVDAIAHPDHTVTITWSDGARGVVDFLPIIDRGGWFTPLRDGDYFAATMIILVGGAGLTWPEEIDYASDALRRDAFPHGLPG